MSTDDFSVASRDYARFRPRYPETLFDWVAGLCAGRRLAWDVACGSGQATRALASRFGKVVATDASLAQLDGAPAIQNVAWRVASATQSRLEERYVDLITVAQALHWFDLEAFWTECRRVLTPNGVIAMWCYGTAEVVHPGTNRIFQEFYHGVVGRFWPAGRRMVEEGYAGLDFPYEPLPSPVFEMTARWDAEALAGYCASWSATKRRREEIGVDPIPALRAALERELQGDRVDVHWPLSVHAGRLFHVEHERPLPS